MSCRNEEVFPACSQKPFPFYFSQYFQFCSFIVLLCLVLLWVQPRSGFRSQGGWTLHPGVPGAFLPKPLSCLAALGQQAPLRSKARS